MSSFDNAPSVKYQVLGYVFFKIKLLFLKKTVLQNLILNGKIIIKTRHLIKMLDQKFGNLENN